MIDRRPRGRAVFCGTLVDSEALLLRWDDPGLQWGLGVFETIALRGAAPRHVDEHLRRLAAAASRLNVPLPAPNDLKRAVFLVAEGAPAGRGWLKILLSRSGQWAIFGGTVEPDDERRSVSAVVLPWRRHRLDPTAGLKTLSFAAGILGLEEARRRGADEGLWLNDRGHVIEACTGNVFAVHGRAVVTPALSEGPRDGVTRSRAIGALRELGLSVRQAKVRIATLRAADEIFLTSSLKGVRAVVRVDGRIVRTGAPGRITQRLGLRLQDDEALQDAVIHPDAPGGV